MESTKPVVENYRISTRDESQYIVHEESFPDENGNGKFEFEIRDIYNKKISTINGWQIVNCSGEWNWYAYLFTITLRDKFGCVEVKKESRVAYDIINVYTYILNSMVEFTEEGRCFYGLSIDNQRRASVNPLCNPSDRTKFPFYIMETIIGDGNGNGIVEFEIRDYNDKKLSLPNGWQIVSANGSYGWHRSYLTLRLHDQLGVETSVKRDFYNYHKETAIEQDSYAEIVNCLLATVSAYDYALEFELTIGHDAIRMFPSYKTTNKLPKMRYQKLECIFSSYLYRCQQYLDNPIYQGSSYDNIRKKITDNMTMMKDILDNLQIYELSK